MGQRHEHFPLTQTSLPNDLFDRGVSPRIAVFVFESIEDAAGCVMLLAVDGLVALQDLVDYLQEGTDLPLGPWLSLPIAGRLGMLQDLDERVPVDPELAAHASFATLLDLDQTSNLSPLLHVRKHL
jgi:hypothetical protein